MERQSLNQETDRGEHNARVLAAGRQPSAIDMDYYLARARRRRAVVMRRALRAALRALARQLKRAGSAWQEYRCRHRLEQELRVLDRRQLADIGLTRSDLPAVVDGSYFRDTSRRPHAPVAHAAAWIDREAPGVSRAAV